MRRIRDLDEYKALIKDTLADLDELEASIEYDEEFMGNAREFLSALKNQLADLLESIENNSYRQADKDLAFMAIVRRTDSHLLPFKHAFHLINDAHKRGFTDQGNKH